MRILAIDPGNIQSAYVIFDGKKIHSKAKTENHHMRDIVMSSNYDKMAIEMISSYGMAVGQSVFYTCVWVGRFMELAKVHPVLVYRKDIKMHVCGQMRANDSNIRQALIDRFEPTLMPRKRPCGILKGVSKDMWAALALACYIYDNEKTIREMG